MGVIDESGQAVEIEVWAKAYGVAEIRDGYESVEEAQQSAEFMIDANSCFPFAIVVGGDVVTVRSPDSGFDWRPPRDDDVEWAEREIALARR